MHLVSPYRMSPPSCTHVSIDDYNKVCQLYEAVHLKLAVARLSDKHISIKLTWRLLLVEVEGRSAAGVLVVELDVDRWSLKRPRRPAAKIQRRRLPNMS
ncbi:hypothetical protein JCGZ_00131 [Jatropha curcas]|uniref:Uncharacterized protein n=1 Tax=Jatropha curcas TaxID=180498 RepID=A0A067JW88_JATCU|nr:hypothetical protein JCGZ_00131 [Jatropha curcas]